MAKKSKQYHGKKKHKTKNNKQPNWIMITVFFVIFGLSTIGFAAWYNIKNQQSTDNQIYDQPYSQTQDSEGSTQTPLAQQSEQIDGQSQNKEHIESTQAQTDSSISNSNSTSPDGSTDYQNYCANCHGENGEGDSGPKLTNTKETADEIAAYAENGSDKMPSFYGQLDGNRLKAVAEYVKSL